LGFRLLAQHLLDSGGSNPGQAKLNALPVTLANLGGNRVVLDLGGETYATCFHFYGRHFQRLELRFSSALS